MSEKIYLSDQIKNLKANFIDMYEDLVLVLHLD